MVELKFLNRTKLIFIVVLFTCCINYQSTAKRTGNDENYVGKRAIITIAPCLISNDTFHKDPKTPTTNLLNSITRYHIIKLIQHKKILFSQLCHPM